VIPISDTSGRILFNPDSIIFSYDDEPSGIVISSPQSITFIVVVLFIVLDND